MFSYDESIPISLEFAPFKEDDSPLGDANMASDSSGQEMQERKGGLASGFGVVPGGTGAGVGEAAMGGYVPEISMEDVQDSDVEVLPKGKAKE